MSPRERINPQPNPPEANQDAQFPDAPESAPTSVPDQPEAPNEAPDEASIEDQDQATGDLERITSGQLDSVRRAMDTFRSNNHK